MSIPSLSSVIFYGIGGLLILSSLAVVLWRNVFHSALALVLALSLVAAVFIELGADFLGAGQILVYVGGIMIIMLFVIMLSQQAVKDMQRQTNDQWLPALFLAVVVAAGLIKTFGRFFKEPLPSPGMVPTTVSIGRLLLGDMIVPFEAISLALLAALVGAVLFSQDKESK